MPHPKTTRRSRRLPVARAIGAASLLAVAGLALLPGCSSPFDEDARDADLQRSLLEATEREMSASVGVGGAGGSVRTLTRPSSDLRFSSERMAELDRMAGPDSYDGVPAATLQDLFGEVSTTVQVNLERVIASAVRNNLSVESARLGPAISSADLIAAQAAFDWVFFGSVDWANTDQPHPFPAVAGSPVGSNVNNAQSFAYETGVRRRLTSGGELSISQGYGYVDDNSPGIIFIPDPSQTAFLDLGLRQPLLRGFGTDVNLAEVRLARNAERDSVEALRTTLQTAVTETERAYWNLVRAQRSLEIRRRLLDRGVETRDVLAGRLEFDVKPAEYSDAVARVEGRLADVLRAENVYRLASDRLKALINDDQFTVGSETLIVPVDAPLDQPIEFSLLDTVTSAIDRRPELRRALLRIDDASIRQQVAENARLPLLDLALRTRFNGLDDDLDGAYGDITDASFVDYLASVQFEQPIGNRAAEAGFRASRLRRMQAVVDYREAAQNAVLAVKRALRDVVTNYQLIEQTRSARLAAAENLRTLGVEEQTLRGLTPDFLDLKLRRQEALAVAELAEVDALVDYNIALADLSNAMGVALERNRITFVVPDAPDPR